MARVETHKRKFGMPSTLTRYRLRKMRAQRDSERVGKTAGGGWERNGFRCAIPLGHKQEGWGPFTKVWGPLANAQTRRGGKS